MKTFKIAALLPHGNIQTKLQLEQNEFCRKADIIKAAPFLCILEKTEAGTPNSLILSKYSELFQSLPSVPEFSPLKIAHFRAFRNLNDEISIKLSEETFKVGSFLYKSGELLYGSAEIKARASKSAPSLPVQLENDVQIKSEAIPLKVFQLAVFSINVADENTGGNLVTWQAEAAKWIRSFRNS
ncbi:MAG: hypothetical protein J5631_04180 [Spirochaetaceae bacterium]|nr:hypothetical protein [Spirochaetaceae bacterium]